MSDDASTPALRVGWGYDAHVLNNKPPLVLGGVVVSETMGIEATSDGDVLAHAITDAVLGACALGDLGEHFPSSDPLLSDADSIFLLRQAVAMALAAGFRVAFVDSTVVAEQVRVAPHRQAIRENLAAAIGIATDGVSVKATSTDGLGFTGTAEGLAAVAVVTVVPTP